MRTLIDIQSDLVAARKRLVSANMKRDPVAYHSAARKIMDLTREASDFAKSQTVKVQDTNRKLASVRKRVFRAVRVNITQGGEQAPRLRSSLDTLKAGPKGAIGFAPKRGAKHSQAFTGSRQTNRLERSPIKGSAPGDRR